MHGSSTPAHQNYHCCYSASAYRAIPASETVVGGGIEGPEVSPSSPIAASSMALADPLPRNLGCASAPSQSRSRKLLIRPPAECDTLRHPRCRLSTGCPPRGTVPNIRHSWNANEYSVLTFSSQSRYIFCCSGHRRSMRSPVSSCASEAELAEVLLFRCPACDGLPRRP